MIKIPAEKLASAVSKHLLPGLIRSLSKGPNVPTYIPNTQENQKRLLER